MKILVAGCGWLGSAIARRYADAGHEVYGLRRSTQPLPVGIIPIRADLARLDESVALPRALDLCVCTIAAGARDAASSRETYIEGLGHLVRALRGSRGARPPRLVYTSSTGVYGESGGGRVDERTDPAPSNERGRLLLAAERLVLDGAPGAIVARLTGLYGPGRTRLLDGVLSGSARRPPGRDPFTNRIHRDDAAGAIVHLAALERSEALYVVTDDEPAPMGEVIAWIARRAGLPVPPPGDRPRGPGKRCVNARLIDSGFALRYPTYREGYEALMAARRDS